MNKFHLRKSPLIKLALSATLSIGLITNAKADTLYGPLRAGESLSGIVNQNYLTSPYDNAVIMREIFRMNPQAFINNNMGLIRQGVMLTLPSDATLRRSRPSQPNPASTVTPAAPSTRSRELVQTLEKTLTQVRNQRDQANLRARRVETESASKIDSLNSRVEQLETEKENTGQQLSTSEAQIVQLRQSLEKLSEENSQLTTKNEQAASVDSSDELSKQLEESNQTIAQKQQQITELESSVSELKTASESLQASHQDALKTLQDTNKALEDKLAAQVQTLDKSDDATEQLDTKITELNIEHQQQLSALQASLDAKTSELTSTQQDTKKLTDQQESEIAALKSEHQKALEDLNASHATVLAEKTTSEASLRGQIEALEENGQSAALEITQLTDQNAALTTQLTDTKTSLDTLAASKAATAEQEVVVESVIADPVDSNDANAVLSGPVTKQLIAERLESPVAFPLWGLLLGAFALGFTSLMMLFARRREQVIPVAVKKSSVPQSSDEVTPEEEQLVFRASDPSVQDPDIETLRVPPRRDPSRVAILDPTMAATATAAAVATAVTTTSESSDQQLAATQLLTPPISGHDELEGKLKLLIAEAYEELGDPVAANELLLEVQAEGNPQQIETAVSIITRLNH